jgi:hypothetical protein
MAKVDYNNSKGEVELIIESALPDTQRGRMRSDTCTRVNFLQICLSDTLTALPSGCFPYAAVAAGTVEESRGLD